MDMWAELNCKGASNGEKTITVYVTVQTVMKEEQRE